MLWFHPVDFEEPEWSGLTNGTTYWPYWHNCDISLNEYYLDDYVSNKRRSVIGHELGHSLGLAHVNGPKLMNDWDWERYDYYSICTPQADDEDGVQAIYG